MVSVDWTWLVMNGVLGMFLQLLSKNLHLFIVFLPRFVMVFAFRILFPFYVFAIFARFTPGRIYSTDKEIR